MIGQVTHDLQGCQERIARRRARIWVFSATRKLFLFLVIGPLSVQQKDSLNKSGSQPEHVDHAYFRTLSSSRCQSLASSTIAPVVRRLKSTANSEMPPSKEVDVSSLAAVTVNC